MFMTAFVDVLPWDRFWIIDLFYTILFSSDILISFFTEYTPTGSYIPVRDFGMIAKNYFDGTFRFDLITTFPFYMLFYE